MILPKGLYYANDSGGLNSRTASWDIEARLIDDDGVALGSWFNLGSESITDNTNTVIRKTYKYAVPAGRYEVRAIRTNAKDMSARAGSDLNWNALKAHLIGDDDFGDVTLLAMKMRATDNLSQRSSRMVNCIVTRKLPIWDAITGWSAPQVTRSIAWACADILKSSYGAKLEDSRIDLQALVALDAIWSARSDTFNGVFDRKLTVWDALSQVARCGRAVAFLQGGLVRFVWDELKNLLVHEHLVKKSRFSKKLVYSKSLENVLEKLVVINFDHQADLHTKISDWGELVQDLRGLSFFLVKQSNGDRVILLYLLGEPFVKDFEVPPNAIRITCTKKSGQAMEMYDRLRSSFDDRWSRLQSSNDGKYKAKSLKDI